MPENIRRFGYLVKHSEIKAIEKKPVMIPHTEIILPRRTWLMSKRENFPQPGFGTKCEFMEVPIT